MVYKKGLFLVIAREERRKPAYREADNLVIFNSSLLDRFTSFAMTAKKVTTSHLHQYRYWICSALVFLFFLIAFQ